MAHAACLSSRLHDDGHTHHHHPGCMWGLLQFLDLHHQHLHIKKILAHRRSNHRPDGGHAGRVKLPRRRPNSPSTEEELAILGSAANFTVEEKANAASKSSGKARMRTLISKKRLKESDSKPKISPLASRLLRTISIHHLQCNDYVLPHDTTPHNNQASTPVRLTSSHEASSSTSSETMPLLHASPDVPILRNQCKLCGSGDARDFLNPKQFDELGNHFLKNQLVLREKLNEAKMILLKLNSRNGRGDAAVQSQEMLDIMDLLNTNRELFLEILQDPTFLSVDDIRLARSGSFPGPEFSQVGSKKTIESFGRTNSKIREGGALRTEAVSLDNNARSSSKKQRNDRTAMTRFKDIKRRIKDIIRENRKERHRISMDGVLHKIPYGDKVSKDAKKEALVSLEGPPLERHEGDSLKSEHGNEVGAVSSKMHASRSIKRSHSLIESLDRYSRLLQTISSRESKSHPERCKLMTDDCDVKDVKSRKSLSRIFSLPELDSYLREEVESKRSNSSWSLKILSRSIADGDLAFDIQNYGKLNSEGTIEEHGIAVDSSESINGGLMEAETAKQQEIRIEDDHSDEPMKPGVVFLLDSPSKAHSFTTPGFLEGSKLEGEDIRSEDLDPSSSPQSHLQEDIDAEFNDVTMPEELTDDDTFGIQVDEKDAAEFNYVRDILRKSGFSSEEYLLGEWYSPEHPVDPLLFEETESESPHDCDSARGESESELPLDHQLLFDLINEVLLEIYDTSFSYCPWLSCFGSRIRPLPVGEHVLQEVWASISWHLSSHQQVDQPLESFVARDFAKNHGWMNLQYEAENVGLQLEDLILDDLLDEAVLHLCDPI